MTLYYTSAAEVAALTNIPVSATTKVTQTTVETWIAEKESELHNVLGSVNLTNPITVAASPNSFNQAATRVREAVAGQLIDSYHGKKTNERLALSDSYYMHWKGFLNEIQRRPEILWDAVQVTIAKEGFDSHTLDSDTYTVTRAFARSYIY